MEEFQKMLVESLPRLRAYAMFLTHDRSKADDLLQEAVVRALKGWQQFKPDTYFNAWMYRIVRNQYITMLRQNRRTMVALSEVHEGLLVQAANQEDKVMVMQLAQALKKLPPRFREALLLVCSNGLSYEETACVLGCSLGTVKSRVWRGRRLMEEMMLGGGSDEVETGKGKSRPGKQAPAETDVARL